MNVMIDLIKMFISDEKTYDLKKNCLDFLNDLTEEDIKQIACNMESEFWDKVYDMLSYYVYNYSRESE